MTEQLWVSAAIGLFKMVGELHRMGFQCLRICPYEYPLAWRLCIAPRSKFSGKNGAFLQHSWDEYPLYSSSQGHKCFGWQEAGDCFPEGLAQLFAERFSGICEAGRGRDWEYAGWLSELTGHVSRTRLLPFVQAEYFEPGPEDLNFLPLKSYEAEGHLSNFPYRLQLRLLSKDFAEERDSLRHSLAKLQRKLAAAKHALE